MDKLLQFLKELQTDKKFKDFDEASIRQGIILRILSLLGWDPFDLNEIQPEYSAKKHKIDFVLKQNDSLKAFIIVKKGLDNFKSHIEMLLESSQSSVDIAIYTTGLSWWFFLPSAEGSIDDKRFWSIDTGKEKIEVIAKRINEFLSKENITSGHAVKLADEIINKRKEVALINEFLPKAWEKVINEPEIYLVDVISEVTKGLCGYKPKREKIVEFVKAEGKIGQIRNKKPESIVIDDLTKIIDEKSEKNDRSQNGYKGKAIESFVFKGNKTNIKSWEDLPCELCNVIYKNHKESFENVVYITLKGRDFFSNNPHQFLINKEIAGTGIYLNTDLTETVAAALCHEILKLFGYEESDLVINTK